MNMHNSKEFLAALSKGKFKEAVDLLVPNTRNAFKDADLSFEIAVLKGLLSCHEKKKLAGYTDVELPDGWLDNLSVLYRKVYKPEDMPYFDDPEPQPIFHGQFGQTVNQPANPRDLTGFLEDRDGFPMFEQRPDGRD